MKYCPRCGCGYFGNANFCPYCGTKLSSGAKKVFGNIWRIIWTPLLYLGMQLVVTFIYMLFVGIAIGIRVGFESALNGGVSEIMSDPDALNELIMLSVNIHIPLIISGCATILTVFLIFRKQWKTESFWSYKRVTPAPLLLSVTLGASLNLLIVGVLNFLPLPETIEQPIDGLFDAPLPVVFLSMALTAAFAEEIIFRGIIQKRLMKMTGVFGAILLQAFIFGFIHLNILQSSYAFVLGLFIGVVYLWHDTIWVPITIHLSFNGASVLLTQLLGDVDIEITPTGLAAIMLIVFVVAAGSMIELYRRRTGEYRNYV